MGMMDRSFFSVIIGILRSGSIRSVQLGFVLLLAIGSVQAQEVRNVNGRKHFVHNVEQGQTLYAISRTFAVEVEDIVRSNPGVESGLAIGQELLIPADAVNKKEARNAPELVADGELLHTVAKKETLFGISRSYNIDVNLLMDRNPELNEGLREGMKIVIPVQKVTADPVETRPAVPERILDHIVQPGETLYSLGKLFVVDPQAIVAANNGLKEGLKAGMTVKIPLRIGVEPPPPTRADSLMLRQRYKVAFLLPFALGRNDSLLASTALEPTFYEPSRIAAQFYGGAKMALDSLEELGFRADVTVLDQGDEARVWNSVLNRPEIKEMDLFIGPFHRTAIEQLVKINPGAHIVCPVPQANKLLLGNPTISKVTPTRSDLIRQTAAYVADVHVQDKIILLKPDIFADKDVQDLMHRNLQDALGSRMLPSSDSLAVITLDRKDLRKIASKLDKSRMNVIVAPSADIEFASALVNNLRSLIADHRITLVGMESWLEFETVSPAVLDQLDFTFAASTFIDLQDPKTQDFMVRYRELYDTDADEYALLGFDVTFYYLKALMMRGTNFSTSFSDVRTEPLHMDFDMSRAGPENGFRNQRAIMLQLRDLQLVRVR